MAGAPALSIPPPAGFGGMGGREVALTAQGRTDRTDKRGSGGFVSWGRRRAGNSVRRAIREMSDAELMAMIEQQRHA